MSDIPQVAFWCGKRVDEMSIEELRKALVIAGTQLQNERRQHMASLDLYMATVKSKIYS
jgi:hypothetical protein